MFKSKLHQIAVTEANLFYEGSITIDEDLLEMAELLPYEKVQIVNINNGERFETYTIPGPRGSRICCLNGPAARKVTVGDIILIISYGMLEFEEAKSFTPTISICANSFKGIFSPELIISSNICLDSFLFILNKVWNCDSVNLIRFLLSENLSISNCFSVNLILIFS